MVKRILFIIFLFSLLLIISIFIGLSFGTTKGTFKFVLDSLLGIENNNPMFSTIIWELRLPRVLSACIIGGALALGGLVFQVILRNPLAEPYILGISGGSAIGAIIGILLNLASFPFLNILSFLGGMITIFLVLFISKGHVFEKTSDSMLLIGVMINAFCSAFIMFIISIAKSSKLHNIMFWIIGDISSLNMNSFYILSACIIPCFIILFCLSNSMNLLLMGKEMAVSMGLNIGVVIFSLLLISSFMISSIVAWCGLLGFVGLVVPHFLRLILGSDHRILVPASILAGGSYMVLCDVTARLFSFYSEVPVGIVTAMIGAPVFIILLKKTS